MKRRGVFLVVLFVFVVVLSGATMIRTHWLEKELKEVAVTKVREFRQEYDREGAKGSARIGSRVAASRSFLIFGKPAGKISVFVARPSENGKVDFVETFEFFYERSEKGWRQTESGRCTSELCTLEGKEVLDGLDKK